MYASSYLSVMAFLASRMVCRSRFTSVSGHEAGASDADILALRSLPRHDNRHSTAHVDRQVL